MAARQLRTRQHGTNLERVVPLAQLLQPALRDRRLYILATARPNMTPVNQHCQHARQVA